MSAIIAIDIGGTRLRVAAFTGNETKPSRVERLSTQNQDQDVFDRLAGAIDAVWPEEGVSAISTAIPGPIDPAAGIVISTPNIPGWVRFPFAEKLQDKYHVPVLLGNDANLAAVGEWRYGAGQGHDNLLYLTISTGIGGGVIAGGRLLTGSHGMAAELGHLTVLPDGPRCSCGQQGHIEAIASGPAIARYVSERIQAGRASSLSGDPHITAREVSAAARQGDALCLDAFAWAGKYLGLAVASYLHIFNPSILIFGGGVSQSGSLLFEPMQESMAAHVMDKAYLSDLQITTAKLGDDAGLLGALAQARDKLTTPSTRGDQEAWNR